MSIAFDEETGVYVERNCVVHHEGRSYEAGGAFVSPTQIIAYLGRDNVLQDWHGRSLGSYRIKSTWTIRSWTSNTMHQVEAVVNGHTYTGRSCGIGIIYRGRRKKRDL